MCAIADLFICSNNIAYIYSAAGEKLAKKMKDNTYQYYAGSMVYDNAKALNYILFDEGKVNKSSTSYVYEYHLKDHLGNTRVAFKSNGSGTTVDQVAEYYPFGSNYTLLSPAGSNNYLYNGKLERSGNPDSSGEKQTDALSGTNLDWYDYGARFYDPSLGRWHNVDPLAEKNSSSSPFIFCMSNPVNYIDPLGLDTVSVNDLPNSWHNFDTNNDNVLLNEIAITPNNSSTNNNFMPIWLFLNTQGIRNIKTGVDYLSAAGSAYIGNIYIERPMGGGYFRTKKGKTYSLSVLERQANGKFVRGVQGLRTAANTAKYSVRLLTKTINYVSTASTLYSANQFVKNPNLSDGFDVTIGIVGYFWWEIGVFPAVTGLTVFSSSAEMEQIQQNIRNDDNPLNNIYVPGLGTDYYSPF